jgi:multidrug efflux pump subunit AcrA (membrane-fusion protein)
MWVAVLAVAVTGSLGAAAEPGAAPGTIEVRDCRVSPASEAKVAAREAGVLVKVLKKKGDLVSKGDVIAQIDDDQPRMEKRRAKAEHDQTLAKAESDVDVRYAQKAEGVAEKAFEKAEQSHRAVSGSVTDVERDRLRLEWEKSGLQIEQAQLERRLASLAADAKQAEVEAADNAIERRLIRSPIDGYVDDVLKHEGEWMQPGDVLAHVINTDKLLVEGFVELSVARPTTVKGRPVRVVVELENGRTESFEGRISFVSRRAVSGDYRVDADVVNRQADGDDVLPAGITAKMFIDVGAAPAAAGR